MTKEEAIEIIKRNCTSGSDLRKACELFIPELKESEDERIRKKIIRIIQVGGYMSPEEKDKAFVWLEKQGNLMKALQISNARIGELIEENYYLKEQLEKQKEQKSEWSEEDEDKLMDILEMIKYADTLPPMDIPSCTGHLHPSNEYKEKLSSWLKSLKPQPKNEWNEEDKNKLNHILEIVHIASGREVSVDEKEELDSFLKSLRPQPRKKIYQAAKHDLAIRFMNYLDENRPEGKMSLSEGECGDIDKAFKENDWAKIIRYAEKYLIQSEQQPAVWSEEDE